MTPVDERRDQPRSTSSGEVQLLIGPLSIPGRLADWSSDGIRVEHMYAALASGQIVRIFLRGDVRTAKAVWSKIGDEGVETGFRFL